VRHQSKIKCTTSDKLSCVHKSHIPAATSAPAIPAAPTFLPTAAAVEGLVDGALKLGVVGVENVGTDEGRLKVDERLIGGGTSVLLMGTEVVKVVVLGGDTEITVDVMIV
jgi:hypothetical protein